MELLREVCQTIVNPPRLKYTDYDLGPFSLPNGRRVDFLVNSRGCKLVASIYLPNQSRMKILVLYLHSMDGSRLESTCYAEELLQAGVCFCSFDFAGCGNSEGQGISFGVHERIDAAAVLKALREKFQVRKVVLWGRSMGAVCAIKYCELMEKVGVKPIQIVGLCLDSPFSSFRKLVTEIAHSKYNIPVFMSKLFLAFVGNQLERVGGFRLDDLELQDPVKQLQLPALFMASPDDKTIDITHSEALFSAYSFPEKQLVYISGLHNQSRDNHYFAHILSFLRKLQSSSHIHSVPFSSSFTPSHLSLHPHPSHPHSSLALPQFSFQLNKRSSLSPLYEVSDHPNLNITAAASSLTHSQRNQQIFPSSNTSLIQHATGISPLPQDKNPPFHCNRRNTHHLEIKLKKKGIPILDSKLAQPKQEYQTVFKTKHMDKPLGPNSQPSSHKKYQYISTIQECKHTRSNSDTTFLQSSENGCCWNNDFFCLTGNQQL